MSDIPEFLTHGEAAKLLGVTRVTLTNWVRKGLVPVSRKSGARRVHRMADLLKAVRENCLTVSPEILEVNQ
jgi:excisionase family DNA binding protein